MKKFILSMVCFASLGAAQFEHKITVTPTEKTSKSGKKEYLAEIEVKKLSVNEDPFVIEVPLLVCMEGTKAEVQVKSPDEADVLIVSVLVPENDATEAKASIYMTEFKEVVISKEEKIKIGAKEEDLKIGTKRKFRTWADIRELRAEEAEAVKASTASQARS